MSAQWFGQSNLEVSAKVLPLEGRGLRSQRALDLVVVTLAIIALLPLMTIISIVIWASDGGPAFYGHVRVGRMGRLFRCWKFRSMVSKADQVLATHLARDPAAREEWAASHKLRRDPRITAVGRFLRVSSLDELPQLWNVLIGDMSIVGPRPIVLLEEVARYKSNFFEYCSCRPRA